MPLLLDLFRHGEALPAAEGGDAERPLSLAGIAAVKRMADEFARNGWRPNRAFTSPLRRARETAALLLGRVAPDVEPEVLPELMPETHPEHLLEALARRVAEDHVLLVGHQPLLGRLTAYLEDGEEQPFRTASLVRIRCELPLAPAGGKLELRLSL